MSSIDDASEKLRDAALRRALNHAPDMSAAPDWRLRKAILERAHDAVAPPDAAVSDIADRPSWWQRLFSGGLVPWSAGFATVLVATLVTVVWQRMPVPGAGLERDEAYVAVAPKAPAPAAPASPPPVAPLLPEIALPPPPSPPQQAVEAPREISETPGARAAQRAAERAERAERAQAAKEARARSEGSAAAQAPSADVAPRPVPPDTSASLARREAEAAATAGPVAAPRPPARAAAPGATAGAPAAAPPTFAALAQWNRITITRPGGESRSLPRSEASELSALMGSAALAAVGAQPLAAAPEWTVMLERNGEVMAVFEVGARQVRWREGGTRPATGTPPAPALAAVRDALRAAMKPSEPAAQQAPQSRAEQQPLQPAQPRQPEARP